MNTQTVSEKKTKQKSVRIYDDEGMEVGVELVVWEIQKVASAMKRVDESRATRDLLLALIQDDTGLPKTKISLVLDSMRYLETTWLKEKGKTK